MEKHHRSHLFQVRIWQEKHTSGRVEWRGQVKHVLSGEVRYFRGLPALVKLLDEIAINPLQPQDE